MQTKQSTKEGRHDGIEIPSATRPFAVVKKTTNKERTNRMIKLFNQSVGRLRLTKTRTSIRGWAASAAVISMLALAVAPARADERPFVFSSIDVPGATFTQAFGINAGGGEGGCYIEGTRKTQRLLPACRDLQFS